MKKILIILFVVNLNTSVSQELFDSLKYSFSTKPKPAINLGTRNSFITNQFAKMRSVFVGLNYADITRVGLSFNWMAKGFTRIHNHQPDTGLTVEVDKMLRLYYFAPYIEYNFFRKKHWEGTIPVMIGVGWSNFTYSYNNDDFIVNKDWVFVYEPAITLQYRFLKYFAIGGGGGFRLMLKNNKSINETFSSPIYMVWFKIFFGDVYKSYIKDVENVE